MNEKKNPNIYDSKKVEEIMKKVDSGEITLEEANKGLWDAGSEYHLNPWKNRIGRNEEGVGLLDTGTGTMDKIRIIETEETIRTAEPVFNAEAFKGGPLPVANVKYCEIWYKVTEDGYTMIEM